MSSLTHLDEAGQASMVDVSAKPVQAREAVAAGRILLQPETLRLVGDNALKKGDVLAVARIAGIQAAKQTQLLIPLCHQLPLAKVGVDFELQDNAIAITAIAKTNAQTGVEMEALTAVQVGLLTVYDMCKAVDRGMVIERVQLMEKHGGKSGSFVAAGPDAP